MRIAFYRGLSAGKLGDWLTCLLTLSRYSYCEIIFDDGISGTCNCKHGVKFIDKEYDPLKWEIFEVRCSASEERLARAFFNLWEGSPYDKLGFVLGLLHLPVKRCSKFYASKICGSVIGCTKSKTVGSLYRAARKANLMVP